jgi:hypothetical protein
MPLESILKEAVKSAVSDTIAEKVQEIVAKVLRDHEAELTRLVRGAVGSAIEEMLGALHEPNDAAS